MCGFGEESLFTSQDRTGRLRRSDMSDFLSLNERKNSRPASGVAFPGWSLVGWMSGNEIIKRRIFFFF